MTKLLGILVTTVTLLGCSQPVATITTAGLDKTAHSQHILQWDADFYEQAEEAARKVLTGYLAASDDITGSGGLNPDAIEPWVSPGWLPKEREGFAHYRDTQERTVGVSRFDTAVVQLARFTPEKVFDIGVMVCVDTTEVMVMPLDALNPPDEVLEWHPNYHDFDGTDQEWAVIEDYFATVPVRGGDRRTIVFWFVGETLDDLVIDSSEEWWGANQCLAR
jgi:hypothetical protein